MEIDVRIKKSVFLPVFQHLLESTADIDFLWGGRDGGKSRYVAAKLVCDCLQLPYFRYVLIRKVAETVKDSQVQMIREVIEAWGMESLFEFRLSPMEIRCINGNKFLARGCDNPQKLRSITNPSGAWVEEGNQLNMADFITIGTTLRASEVKTKQYYTFNPETDGDYKKHWLWPYMAENVSKGIFTFNGQREIKLPSGQSYVMKYTSTHCTYLDNPYCSPERQARLEELNSIDPYYYRVFTLGLFGNKKNERPFVLSYSPEKHNGFPELDRDEIVYVSFDFNKNPMCCTVVQHYDGLVRVLRTIKIPNSDIYELCEYVAALYSGCHIQVTGDASGKNRSALMRDNLNYYSVIMEVLGLNAMHLDVPESNPPLEKNRMLVNAVLATYPVIIHTDDAAHLIYDFLSVRCRADGSLEKGNRDDPDQQADALDTWRYFCNTYMKPYISYEGH